MQTVTLIPGQVANVNITVAPLAGNGILNLSAVLTGFAVTSLTGTLAPVSNLTQTTNLSFTVANSTATLTPQNQSIAAGYYLLSLQGNGGVAGVDIVRMVANQTTAGVETFVPATSSFVLTANPTPQNPILLSSISGIPAKVLAGASFTATASATDGTQGALYMWYLNGVLLSSVGGNQTGTSTSSSYNLVNLAAGTTALM